MLHTTVITWVKRVGQLLPDAYEPETIPLVGELDELETFVRVPEFSSLLAAKLSMNSEVTVIASETDVGVEDTALIIDDKLIAKGTREFIDSLASFALKTAANPETWKIIHGLRLKVLFAELNRNSE